MILAEVSTLEETMRKLYDGFVTVNKAVFCLYNLQQQSQVFVKNLKTCMFPSPMYKGGKYGTKGPHLT